MRRALVLRHGILLNRYFLLPAERFFRRLGYEVHNRSYPTTRKRIEEHARDLADEVRRIDEDLRRSGEPYEIHALTHSLGGLVLRYAATHFDIPRIRRAVLFVPPNRGSATARYFKDFFLYRWLFGGNAGRQLTEEPPGIFGEAGVPRDTEIGILAGNVRWKLYPVPLDRPHDAIVSVSEAELPPFPLKVLPYGHTPILFARKAWEEAAHFLEHGRFREG
jgi:hypothetical protein